MGATAFPPSSILYADEGSAGRSDSGVGLGKRLTWAELSAELGPYLPPASVDENADYAWTGVHSWEQSPIPSADGTIDLGKVATRWGNVYGVAFHGDGTNLTGVGVRQPDSPAWTGNHTWSQSLLPSSDVTVDLGGTTTRWNDIHALKYFGREYEVMDDGGILRGEIGYNAPLSENYFIYTEDGTYDIQNGGIAVGPGRTVLGGSNVYVEKLRNATKDFQQVYVDNASGGLFGVDPPEPGWSESDVDNALYNLGTAATTPGPWVAFTGLVITVPVGGDVAAGERIDVTALIHCENVTTNRQGIIGIGFGIDAALPNTVDTTSSIGPGFIGNVPVSFSTVGHGGLAAGQTVTLYARIESGSHSSFGVLCDGAISLHELTVSVPSTGGGGSSWPGEGADYSWTGNHSWTQTLEAIGIGAGTASGSDAAGDDFTITGGIATGVGLPGTLSLKTSFISAPGSSPQALQTRMLFNDIGAYINDLSLLNVDDGSDAQELRIYGGYTDASNYERLSISSAVGGPFTIAAEAGGTGVARNLEISLSASQFFITDCGTAYHQIGGTNRMILTGPTIQINAELRSQADGSASLGSESFQWNNLYASGGIHFSGLPTADPVVTGALWSDSGNVVLSGYVGGGGGVDPSLDYTWTGANAWTQTLVGQVFGTQEDITTTGDGFVGWSRTGVGTNSKLVVYAHSAGTSQGKAAVGYIGSGALGLEVGGGDICLAASYVGVDRLLWMRTKAIGDIGFGGTKGQSDATIGCGGLQCYGLGSMWDSTYERLSISSAAGGPFTIAAEAGGTGQVRDLVFGTPSTVKIGAGSGATSNAALNDFVIDTDQTSSGMSILQPSTGISRYGFGNQLDSYIGGVVYSHDDNELTLYANNLDALKCLSNTTVHVINQMGVGIATPADLLHVHQRSGSGGLMVSAENYAELKLVSAYDGTQRETLFTQSSTQNVFTIQVASQNQVQVGIGSFKLLDLPTANPNSAGQLWNSGGTVMISAG